MVFQGNRTGVEENMLNKDRYNEIRRYIEKLTGRKIRDRKIRAIGVNPPYHGLPKRLIEVGRTYADLEPGSPPEEILAIYESESFCVCTPERGALKGLPYFFTRDTVYEVIEME